MDILQNSHSAFRELRLAAGCGVTQLANLLGVPISSLKFWEYRGVRPQWRYMPALAQFFGIDLAEALKLIWKETVGDRCDCCGGEKIFPDKPRAIHLHVKRTCHCGTSRIYRSNQHSKGCNRCGGKTVPRVKVPCIGYCRYSARTFANSCRREIEIRRTELKYYRQNDDENQRSFFNEAEGRGRCGRCASAFRMTQILETQVRRFLRDASRAFVRESSSRRTEPKQRFYETAGFYPHEPLPDIKSLKRLRELLKACHKLTYRGKSGQNIAFHPTSFLRGTKRPHAGDSRPRSVRYLKSMLAGFAKRQLPKNVHGLCLLCDKISAAKVHRRCFLSWQRQHGPHAGLSELASQSRRGTPSKRGSLQLSWTWTIRHKLGGEPLAEIARDAKLKVTKQAVKKRIDFVVNHLPEPKLIDHKWLRKQVRLIRGADTELG